jgi:hypothetical protein
MLSHNKYLIKKTFLLSLYYQPDLMRNFKPLSTLFLYLMSQNQNVIDFFILNSLMVEMFLHYSFENVIDAAAGGKCH